MAATLQAQRLSKALRNLGLRGRKTKAGYAEFGVSTAGNGSTGFGHATATIYSEKAAAMIVEKAEDLVAEGFQVSIYYLPNGTAAPIVTTGPAELRRIANGEIL